MGKGSAGWARECGSFFNKMCSRFNRLLSYKSQKVVRVIDRRMGLLAGALRILILGYLAIAIYLSEAYKTNEYATGALIARGSGESYSTDNHHQVRFWDFADVLYPPTEVGAIFVATRVVRTNVQTVQMCANPAHPCSEENADNSTSAATSSARRLMAQAPGARRLLSAEAEDEIEDETALLEELVGTAPPSAAAARPPGPPQTTEPQFSPGDEDGAKEDPQCSGLHNGLQLPEPPYGTGKCAGNGKGCLEAVWCPAEGTNPLRTLDMKLQNPQVYQIKFQSAIAFPVYAPDEEPLQYEHAPLSLTELLAAAGADQEEALTNGAVVSARVMYECDMDATPIKDCTPTVTFRRLDNEEPGFSYRRATYYYAQGQRARDVSRLVGVRIQLSAHGVAKQSSYLQLILQCSIGLTLLGMAGALTDYYMCNICDDRMLLSKYKVEDSDDFSDLAERLQNLDPERQRFLLQEKRHRQAVAAKMKKKRT